MMADQLFRRKLNTIRPKSFRDTKKYNCNFCEKVFPYQSCLNAHMKQIHDFQTPKSKDREPSSPENPIFTRTSTHKPKKIKGDS